MNVVGSGLGTMNVTSGVSIELSSCEPTLWVSETPVVCEASRGAGGSGVATLSAARGVDGSVSAAVSVHSGTVSTSGGADAGGRRMPGVTVYGSSLVALGGSSEARTSVTSGEASELVSGTCDVCMKGQSAVGTGGGPMSVLGRWGSGTSVVSEDGAPLDVAGGGERCVGGGSGYERVWERVWGV